MPHYAVCGKRVGKTWQCRKYIRDQNHIYLLPA